MADIADKANDFVELTDALSLREVQSKKPDAEFTGECLLCGEPLDRPKRWCSVEHRDRWDLERKRGLR